MLAWVLLYEEGLEFGPGVRDGDAPDLVVHDLTGKVSTWVACGDSSPKLARRILQHNRDAAVHLVMGDLAVRQSLRRRGGRLGRAAPGLGASAPVDASTRIWWRRLAGNEALRQRWSLTLVGDHIYVDAQGVLHDGPILRG